MTRMTREFSLVLLGAGLLTAGYFAWPEQDFEKRADEQARKRLGGPTNTRHHGHVLIFYSAHGSSTSTSARSPAMGGVSRGGFGTVGGRVSGG